VAGNFDRYVRSKRSGAGFKVAVMAIKSEKRSAPTDNAEVDGAAAGLAKVVFRGIHQLAPEAGALARWIYPQQSEITAITAEFNIDATRKAHTIFRKQKLSFFHVRAHAIGIGAIAPDERLLDAECGVDEVGQSWHIVSLTKANDETVCARAQIR